MQSRSSQSEAIAITESETYQTLLARAHRRTGGVPPERIVRHVLSVTQRRRLARPARRARCGASPLRVRSHGRDSDRRTATRPAVGSVRDPRAEGRAHARTARCSVGSSRSTAVASAPISSGIRSACASTSSPSSRTWSRSGVACDVERESAPEPAPLRWDPVRPLTGPGDWLARVRWVDGTPDRDLRRWLRPANGHGWTVTVPGAPQQRLALVDRLLAALRDGDGEPALHALLQEERARLARQIQTASTRKHLHQRAAHPQAIALSLSTRRRRTVLRARAPAPGRRHGSRQDRAGDCRLPRPLAHRPRPPWPPRRPRRAQAAVAS